jgi:hypothetical protein
MNRTFSSAIKVALMAAVAAVWLAAVLRGGQGLHELNVARADVEGFVFDARGLFPGQSVSSTFDVTNSGEEPSRFSLDRASLADSSGETPLSAMLDVMLFDCGALPAAHGCATPTRVIYRGSLLDMRATYDLGVLDPGESHRYGYRVVLSPTAGDAYQGTTSMARFRWLSSEL